MVRLFILSLTVGAFALSFAGSARADYSNNEQWHLVSSNAKMARSTTPKTLQEATDKIGWQYQDVRENAHHRMANKVSRSHNLVFTK